MTPDMTPDSSAASAPKASRSLIALGLIAAAASVLLDQASKELAFKYFSEGQPEIQITSFFSLVRVWNFGISFGMFAGHRQPMILTGVSLVIIMVLLGWLTKTPYRMVAIALGLVIGGAIGNVIDRLRFGAVADFLDFHVLGYHWPAFNIADSSIFIGVVLLCIHSMFIESKIPSKESL